MLIFKEKIYLIDTLLPLIILRIFKGCYKLVCLKAGFHFLGGLIDVVPEPCGPAICYLSVAVLHKIVPVGPVHRSLRQDITRLLLYLILSSPHPQPPIPAVPLSSPTSTLAIPLSHTNTLQNGIQDKLTKNTNEDTREKYFFIGTFIFKLFEKAFLLHFCQNLNNLF